jgi:hypothetical protein
MVESAFLVTGTIAVLFLGLILCTIRGTPIDDDEWTK